MAGQHLGSFVVCATSRLPPGRETLTISPDESGWTFMTSHELFAGMPPKLATEILEYAYTTDKDLYRATLAAVAESRKVRAVFLERQPRATRNNTMITMLSRGPLEPAADNLLRYWLLKKHNAVLTDFLDGLKIP